MLYNVVSSIGLTCTTKQPKHTSLLALQYTHTQSDMQQVPGKGCATSDSMFSSHRHATIYQACHMPMMPLAFHTTQSKSCRHPVIHIWVSTGSYIMIQPKVVQPSTQSSHLFGLQNLMCNPTQRRQAINGGEHTSASSVKRSSG